MQLDHLVLGRPVELVGTVASTGERPPGKFLIFAMASTKVRRLRVGPALVAAVGEQADGHAPRLDRPLLLDEGLVVVAHHLRVLLVPAVVASAHAGVVAALALGTVVVEAAEGLGRHALLAVERLLVGRRNEAERRR